MSAELLTPETPTAAPDEERLMSLLGQLVNDLGATMNSALVLTGDRLGLYRALASDGPLTSTELAGKTGTTERYVREWLASQAGSGYVEFDAATGRFYLTPEQIAVFADDESHVLMTGGFYSARAAILDEPKVTEAFRTGEGVAWGDHDHELYCGVEKFFRPTYKANLVGPWIDALDGVREKLTKGARVADVGCGHGVSTLVMAEAFPNSTFIGFDLHEGSIEHARKAAAEAGLKNVTFEVATAKEYPGENYDLVCFFDCLHDMGDPVGAIAHTASALAKDGTLMLVEPAAGDRLEDNLNPVGRLYYAYSTMLCTPSSLSQEVGLGLGAQAGEARLRDVVTKGGFASFRRVTQSPFNIVLEAKL